MDAEVESLRGTVASMSQAELQQKLDGLVQAMDEVEGRNAPQAQSNFLSLLAQEATRTANPKPQTLHTTPYTLNPKREP